MKTGAGDDPFAEPDEDDPVEQEPENPEEAEPDTATAATETDDSPAKEDIPWVLRRSAVKEDRDNVHQFFLRDEYADREEELRSEVADILGMRTKDVKKLDLREAMFAVVDAEEIAAELDEWGYEYLK